MRSYFSSVTLAVGALVAPMASAAEAAKPNVLFIAIDDQKPTLGCYGDTLAKSPNIDSVAAKGTVFLNNHCQWAVCGPTRASLLTGLMPDETGVKGFQKMRAVLPAVITIPQHFKAHGYRTLGAGKISDPRCVDSRATDDPASWTDPFKSPTGGYVSPTRLTYDFPDLPDSQFNDGAIANAGINQLNLVKSGSQPFFLAVGFKKPHIPWVAPKKYWDMFTTAQFQPSAWQTVPVKGSAGNWGQPNETGEYSDPIPATALDGVFPQAKQQEFLHAYYASSAFVDAQVGRLLSALEASGKASNTIVVIWGDHGYHLGDHGRWGKHTNFEQAANAPLIIADLRTQNGGKRITSPTGFIDLFPTLCELAGLPQPSQPISATVTTGRPLRGVSLVPLLTGASTSVRTGVLSTATSNRYGVRNERYRYLEQFLSSGKIAKELYDLQADPGETINIASQNPALVAQMAALLRSQPESAGCTPLAQ